MMYIYRFLCIFIELVQGDYTNPGCNGKQVIVELFEWKWTDVEKECEMFLGPMGFCGVQISPPNEHAVITDDYDRPWWERYETVSYKLKSRSGTEKEFMNMVDTCNQVGVRIYADVVINNMVKNGRTGTGSAGSHYNAETLSFIDVPYEASDFHSKCSSPTGNVDTSTQPDIVRNCYKDGRVDLNQSKPEVKNRIVQYLNTLLAAGVGGYRIDSAINMLPADLADIENKAWKRMGDSSIAIFLSFNAIGQTEIKVENYSKLGFVTDFEYCELLAKAITDFSLLYDLTHQVGNAVINQNRLIFTDNHENQRSKTVTNVLTFKQRRQYIMGVSFTLAQGRGLVRLMSSYNFTEYDEGPPKDFSNTVKNVIINPNGECGGGWICEHRWKPIAEMVRFKNAVGNSKITHWYQNGNDVAFGREDKGFFAMSSAGNMDRVLQTGLSEGVYCDIIHDCSNKIDVDASGKALINISNYEEPIIAIYQGSKLTETTTTELQATALKSTLQSTSSPDISTSVPQSHVTRDNSFASTSLFMTQKAFDSSTVPDPDVSISSPSQSSATEDASYNSTVLSTSLKGSQSSTTQISDLTTSSSSLPSVTTASWYDSTILSTSQNVSDASPTQISDVDTSSSSRSSVAADSRYDSTILSTPQNVSDPSTTQLSDVDTSSSSLSAVTTDSRYDSTILSTSQNVSNASTTQLSDVDNSSSSLSSVTADSMYESTILSTSRNVSDASPTQISDVDTSSSSLSSVTADSRYDSTILSTTEEGSGSSTTQISDVSTSSSVPSVTADTRSPITPDANSASTFVSIPQRSSESSRLSFPETSTSSLSQSPVATDAILSLPPSSTPHEDISMSSEISIPEQSSFPTDTKFASTSSPVSHGSVASSTMSRPDVSTSSAPSSSVITDTRSDSTSSLTPTISIPNVTSSARQSVVTLRENTSGSPLSSSRTTSASSTTSTQTAEISSPHSSDVRSSTTRESSVMTNSMYSTSLAPNILTSESLEPNPSSSTSKPVTSPLTSLFSIPFTSNFPTGQLTFQSTSPAETTTWRLSSAGSTPHPTTSSHTTTSRPTSTTTTTITTTTTKNPTTTDDGYRETIIFIHKYNSHGSENVFIDGGIDHRHRPGCSYVAGSRCSIPIRQLPLNMADSAALRKYTAWGVNDNYLDWYRAEISQGTYNGQPAQGTPAILTSNLFMADNFVSENTYGPNYWMVKVDMDCTKTEHGWFEFKVVEGQWESNIGNVRCCEGNIGGCHPYGSSNHFARCGSVNVVDYQSGRCTIDAIRTTTVTTTTTTTTMRPPRTSNLFSLISNGRTMRTTTTSSTTADDGYRRTIVFIHKANSNPDQRFFIEGGIDHAHRQGCTQDAATSKCAIPIRHIIPRMHSPLQISMYRDWSVEDNYLDWYGAEEAQGLHAGNLAGGTPAVLTSNNVNAANYVPENRYGIDYWMIDMMMDCTKTIHGWF